MKCTKEHKNHSYIDFGDILIDEETNINQKNELNIYIIEAKINMLKKKTFFWFLLK